MHRVIDRSMLKALAVAQERIAQAAPFRARRH
jgi:hypothetical protein